MNIFCPFCLNEHPDVDKKCSDTGKAIPQTYINAFKRGALIFPVAVIGYKGCGKTTYLSSLVYALYNKLPTKWLSIMILNQSTLDRIEREYIPTLRNGNFPPPTSKFFEEPLILKLSYSMTKFSFFETKREAILILYDTMGGNYDRVDTIKENFPLIKNIPNIIVLIDLYSMELERNKIPVDMKLHSLVNKLYLALDDLDSSAKEKNIIVNFTKIDKFWNMNKNHDDFKPLTEEPMEYTKDMTLYGFYKNVIEKRSEVLSNFVKEKYSNFFEIIDQEYGGYCFITSSSVGTKPNEETNTFSHYNPLGVVDPLLWLLCIY
ncbi:MAG: hypothetical protein N2490_03235 [Ignavibacteria bacterium]|nr:hypothetical protein [Ignavibacteria bacterium]